MGRNKRIYGRAMNESAIIYYLGAWQTTVLLTDTSDITTISCNHFQRMRTEHLMAWEMASRGPNLTRDWGLSSSGFKPKWGTLSLKKISLCQAAVIILMTNKYLSESAGVWNACSYVSHMIEQFLLNSNSSSVHKWAEEKDACFLFFPAEM